MKLSGFAHITSDAPHFMSLARLTRLVASAFGPDRLIWGGPVPEAICAHLAHWPTTEVAQVLGQNLAHLFASGTQINARQRSTSFPPTDPRPA